ncbi:hypothetical protein [Aurantiacibacter sp. MUD61]|uniref:hypothetical protein n=1 Tax=Aurantiacibacter sp. MUD61 TaxID=3009083 RepID=UPI0022F02050|nr:hypothetical protein [Aurantiacibacter sp. MUD61]
MTVAERVSLIFEEAQRLVLAAWKSAAIYLAGVTALGVLADQDPEAIGMGFLLSGVQLGLGYFLLTQMIDKGGLADRRSAGFGTYFGLTLLSGIAIAVGLVFLLIPGIFLFVRWAPLYPVGLVDGDGIGAAMGKSFEMTKPHFWPILVALLPVTALQFVFLIGYLAIEPNYFTLPLLISTFGNLGISAGLIGITAVCTAVFALLDNRNEKIAAVFD